MVSVTHLHRNTEKKKYFSCEMPVVFPAAGMSHFSRTRIYSSCRIGNCGGCEPNSRMENLLQNGTTVSMVGRIDEQAQSIYSSLCALGPQR